MSAPEFVPYLFGGIIIVGIIGAFFDNYFNKEKEEEDSGFDMYNPDNVEYYAFGPGSEDFYD